MHQTITTQRDINTHQLHVLVALTVVAWAAVALWHLTLMTGTHVPFASAHTLPYFELGCLVTLTCLSLATLYSFFTVRRIGAARLRHDLANSILALELTASLSSFDTLSPDVATKLSSQLDEELTMLRLQITRLDRRTLAA
jgi:hypothetical protein